MTLASTIKKTVTLGGRSFAQSKSQTIDESRVRELSLAAAKTGTLSTRTDADTGVLTLASGHGVTTGAVIDVFWSGGTRRNMDVGTVSGTSVPVDGGAGDNLPVLTTAVTAMVVTSEAFVFSGSDAVVITFYNGSGNYAHFSLRSSGAEELYVKLESGAVYVWYSGDGATNPVTGDSITVCRLTHADSTAAATMRFGVGITN